MRTHLCLSILALLLAAPCCRKAKELMRGSRPGSPAHSGAGAALAEIDGVSYASFTGSPGRLAVVAFGAEWCGACKQMEPLVCKLAAEFEGRAVVGKLDVDRSKAFAKSENVTLIPELRFYRDGKQVGRLVGGRDEETLRQMFRKHAAGLEAASGAGETGRPAQAPDAPITPMKKDWLPPGIEKR